MPTWKKVVVSGSAAHLLSVTASAIVVGNNTITTSPSTTILSGSFSGSFTGNGSGLTGVSATFPVTAKTDLATTDQIFINDGANKFITYGNLVIDLAGSGAGTSNLTTTDTGDSLALSSQIAVTGVTASFTGSLTGALIGTASFASTAPYSGLIGIPSGIVSASVLSSPAQGQALLTTNGVAGSTIDLGLEAGDTPTFAGINANGVSFGLATTTATAIQIGGAGTTVTVPGNLTINGTTTIVNTTNTSVKDQFILLNSGSTGTTDGGIVVGNSATLNIGEAFYWENNPSGTGRWAIQSAVDASSAGPITPNSYVVTVSGSSSDPSGNPTYGGGTNGIGNMYVNTSDQSIWIYS